MSFSSSVRFNPNRHSVETPNTQFKENINTEYVQSFNKQYLPNAPLIEQSNFNNLNNTLHNNLNSILKQENIKEYNINIDSVDRNILFYPDPFNFKLSTYNNLVDFNNTTQQDTPFINKILKNVKYIKVNSIIMPRLSDIIDKGDINSSEYNSVYDQNSMNYDSSLEDRYEYNDDYYNNTLERFIVLKINNIPNVITYNTHQELNSTSIILYPKKTHGMFYLAKPVQKNNNIFWTNDSTLIDINSLQFNILNGSYKQLIFSQKNVTKKDITDIRHPLNINMQVNINLVIGVMENELSTKISYNN